MFTLELPSVVAIAIYFGFLAVLIVMIIRRPSVAAGALLMTYLLEQWAQTQSTFFTRHNTLTNYAMGLLVVFALFMRQVKGEGVVKPLVPVFWVTLALVAWCGVTILWSINPEISMAQYRGSLVRFTTYAILVPLCVSSFNDLRASLVTLLSFGSVLLILMLTTVEWDNRGVVFADAVMKAGSGLMDTGNPLALATTAAQVILVAMLMNFRGADRFWQFARWGIVIMGLLVMLKTQTRGQLFACLICGITFFPLSRRVTNIKGFIATSVGLLLFLMIASYAFDAIIGESARWDLGKMTETYGNSRLGTSEILLGRWIEGGPFAWLFGLGHAAAFDPSLLGFYPHLVLAEVLAEEGIVGFVLLWMIPIMTFVSIAKLWPIVRDDPVRRGVLAAAGAAFLFPVILSFKQGSLLGTLDAFAFAIIIGRVAAVTFREYAWTGEEVPPYAPTADDAEPVLPATHAHPPAFGQ